MRVSTPRFNIFRFVLLTVIPTLYSVHSVYFNTLGFEQCIFNLVKYDPSSDLNSQDLLDNILTRTFGMQRWSLLQISTTKLNGQMFFDVPHYPHERCSVNLVVAINVCFGQYLTEDFGLRVYDTENTFIMLQGNRRDCKLLRVWNVDEVPPVFYFRIHVEIVFSICIAC